MGIRATKQQADDLRELWGPDPFALLADEIDREVVRTLLRDAYEPGVSVVDDLASIAKQPHLPPILRRFANGVQGCDRDELHRAIQDAVRREPRIPEVAQADIEVEVQTALTRAAHGEPSPDLHDRVLELMHERDADGLGWYPGKIPEIELNIRVESITAKPRRLGTWPPKPPEPSVVDRLAGLEDPTAAERVARIDAVIAHQAETVQDLRALFEDDNVR
jgi:hypothetical protein